VIDLAFTGLFGDEIPKMAYLRLANPMDAPEPLLDAIRVPGQIVVHHQVGALQVDPFARRVGRQQDFYIGVVPESLLRIHPVFPTHAAVDDNHSLSLPKKR
jgi:hypothetical protein